MPKDLDIDLHLLQKGNVVVYTGPILSRKDRIGTISEMDQVLLDGSMPVTTYYIDFGDVNGLKPVGAKRDDLRGLSFGETDDEKSILKDFDFAFDAATKVWSLSRLAVTTIGIVDDRNQPRGWQIHVFEVGGHPVDGPYNSVHTIHELQNYSVQKYGVDLLADSILNVLGKRYGSNTCYTIK